MRDCPITLGNYTSWSADSACNNIDTHDAQLNTTHNFLHFLNASAAKVDRLDCITRPFTDYPWHRKWLGPIPSAFAVMAPRNLRQRRRVRHVRSSSPESCSATTHCKQYSTPSGICTRHRSHKRLVLHTTQLPMTPVSTQSSQQQLHLQKS